MREIIVKAFDELFNIKRGNFKKNIFSIEFVLLNSKAFPVIKTLISFNCTTCLITKCWPNDFFDCILEFTT